MIVGVIRGYKAGTIIAALALAAVFNAAAFLFSTSAAGLQLYRTDSLRVQTPPGTLEGRHMDRFVEIRSYTLEPGTRGEFHRLFVGEALPMLERWKVEVVAYGPSRNDSDSYFLMRAYASPEERQRSQDAFYGSDEWKKGPREPILALIENYSTISIWLDEATVRGLRAAGERQLALPADAPARAEFPASGNR